MLNNSINSFESGSYKGNNRELLQHLNRFHKFLNYLNHSPYSPSYLNECLHQTVKNCTAITYGNYIEQVLLMYFQKELVTEYIKGLSYTNDLILTRIGQKDQIELPSNDRFTDLIRKIKSTAISGINEDKSNLNILQKLDNLANSGFIQPFTGEDIPQTNPFNSSVFTKFYITIPLSENVLKYFSYINGVADYFFLLPNN